MKILIGIILLTAGLSVYFLHGWLTPRMPSDEELKTRFLKDRDSFTKLGQLFIDDKNLLFASPQKLHRLVGYGLVSNSEPSDEYKTAFDRIGTSFVSPSGVLYIEFIKFPAYRMELEGGDFSQTNYEEKGYALMTSPPEKVQEILVSENTYGNADFKQIEGQWYIYHGIWVSKPE